MEDDYDAMTEEERAAAKAARKAAKKAKKEKRRREEEAEEDDAPAAAGAPAPSEPADDAEEEDEEARAARKAAKKAAKKARREAEAAAESGAASSSSSSAHAAGGSAASGHTAHTASAAGGKAGGFDIDAWRAEHHVGVDESSWDPVTTFPECAPFFGPKLMTIVNGFAAPTAIQAQAWPILLKGRDMVGLAATGSGKTLAFLMPALVKLSSRPPLSRENPGPFMLIVAPTRELAQQTGVIAEKACAAVGMRAACVYGGVPKGPQAEQVSRNGGVHVLTGTPGRLLDLWQDGSLKLDKVVHLVLDEADRMLDMGFEKDIRAIIGALPAAGGKGGRQTAMFSATWPAAIQGIASEFLHKPVKVTIGQAQASGKLAASHSVKQIVEVIQNPHDRDNRLVALLNQYHKSRTNRVLVFGLYKKECDRLERFLKAKGWACVAIHGDMSQTERNKSFEAFKSAKVPLLIATDVAARGLDIPNVEVVINFTFPLTIEDYVHRIGRTGRAGATGISHTLFTPLDKQHAGELVNVLREASAPVPDDLLKFGTHVKKKEHGLYGAHFKPTEGGAAPSAPKKMTFGDDE